MDMDFFDIFASYPPCNALEARRCYPVVVSHLTLKMPKHEVI